MLPEGDIAPEELLKLLSVKEAKSVRDDLPDFANMAQAGPGFEKGRGGGPICWRTLYPSTRWSICNGGLLLAAQIRPMSGSKESWMNGTLPVEVYEWHWMIGPTTMIRVRLPERVRAYPVSPKAQNHALSPNGRNFHVSTKTKGTSDPMQHVLEDLSPGATKAWDKVSIAERTTSAKVNRDRKARGTDYTRGEYSSRALIQILGTMGLLDQRFNQWTQAPRRTDEMFSLFALQFDSSTEIVQIELLHLPNADPHRAGYVCQQQTLKLGDKFESDGIAMKWFTGQDMPVAEEEE